MKYIIICFFYFSSVCILHAQGLRHVKGNLGIDATIHLTKFDPAFSIGYANYITERWIQKTKFNYEKGKIGSSNYQTFFIIPTVSYSQLNIKSIVFFNLEFGGFIGIETSENSEFIKNETVLLYGINAGIEIEYFIINKLAIISNINELISFSSKFGNYRYQLGIGVRFFIK